MYLQIAEYSLVYALIMICLGVRPSLSHRPQRECICSRDRADEGASITPVSGPAARNLLDDHTRCIKGVT